jgi:hypothetical protein
MRRFALIGLTIGALATTSALAASSATAKVLVLSNSSGVLDEGQPVLVSMVGDLRYYWPDMDSELNCEGSKGIEGELITNSAKTDEIVFYNAFGQLAGGAGCEGGTKINAFGFRWLMKLTTAGKLTIGPSVGFADEDGCSYSGKSLKGWFAHDTETAQPPVTLDGVVYSPTLKRTKSSSNKCAKEMLVSYTGFELRTVSGPIFSALG